jgi:hypothetical protein
LLFIVSVQAPIARQICPSGGISSQQLRWSQSLANIDVKLDGITSENRHRGLIPLKQLLLAAELLRDPRLGISVFTTSGDTPLGPLGYGVWIL